MTDPVTNALAVQMEYGDEELRKEIDKRIRKIVVEELFKLVNEPNISARIITNNAYTIEQISRQAFKNAVSSINVY
jgi:hypothetical protein